MTTQTLELATAAATSPALADLSAASMARANVLLEVVKNEAGLKR